MKYGDSVVYVRDGVELNALVLQSASTLDGEFLQLLYLEPSAQYIGASKIPYKVEFSVPQFKEGQFHGWKQLSEPSESEVPVIFATEPIPTPEAGETAPEDTPQA